MECKIPCDILPLAAPAGIRPLYSVPPMEKNAIATVSNLHSLTIDRGTDGSVRIRERWSPINRRRPLASHLSKRREGRKSFRLSKVG